MGLNTQEQKARKEKEVRRDLPHDQNQTFPVFAFGDYPRKDRSKAVQQHEGPEEEEKVSRTAVRLVKGNEMAFQHALEMVPTVGNRFENLMFDFFISVVDLQESLTVSAKYDISADEVLQVGGDRLVSPTVLEDHSGHGDRQQEGDKRVKT